MIFVVDSNAGANPSDLEVKKRLESMGCVVTVKGATPTTSGDADGKVLIITSSTINSGDLSGRLRDVPVPVINWEQALQDDFAMTGNNGGVDRENIGGQLELEIVNASHPLAAGLKAGVVPVANNPASFSWGLPADGAVKIAQVFGDPTKFPIYAYETGASMFGGFKAPARRVNFMLTDNAFLELNADGLKLFDAAVKWAANLGELKPQFNPPVLQGGNLILSWTGGGTLQAADEVTGPWTNVAGARRFYRLRQ